MNDSPSPLDELAAANSPVESPNPSGPRRPQRKPKPDRPHDAWLAPIAGFGLAVGLNFCFIGNVIKDDDVGGVGSLLIRSIPAIVIVVAICFGYFKSFVNLRSGRAKAEGIAGLISNTLVLGIFVFAAIAAFDFARSDTARLMKVLEEADKQLPVKINDVLTLKEARSVPEKTLEVDFVWEVDRGRLSDEKLAELEKIAREDHPKTFFARALRGTEISVRYRYIDQRGDLVASFVIEPSGHNP